MMKTLVPFQKLRDAFHNEGTLICLALASYLVFPFLSRHIDVTAAPVDPGILSVVLVAVLSFLAFKSLTWWIIRIIWPVFAEYSASHFERNFKSLPPWQKVVIYLVFYMLLLYGFVITLTALT